MALFAVSLLAGILTVLAPCVLPVLPVILGATAARRKKYTALVVVVSLSLSVLIFTFLLKATVVFISVPQTAWSIFSGSMIALVGVAFIFPGVFERTLFPRAEKKAQKILGRGIAFRSYGGDVLAGLALGPVFASCSPTFFFILAAIVPMSMAMGMGAIAVYVAGLAMTLFMIALAGERIIGRFRASSDTRRIVARFVGMLFIVLGLLIATGLEKKTETYLIEKSVFNTADIEYHLLQYLR